MGTKEILALLLIFPWTLVFALSVAVYRLLRHDRKRDLLQLKILLRVLRKKEDDDRGK